MSPPEKRTHKCREHTKQGTNQEKTRTNPIVQAPKEKKGISTKGLNTQNPEKAGEGKRIMEVQFQTVSHQARILISFVLSSGDVW